MNELPLKYGLNPNQIPATLSVAAGMLPVTVLNGRPGYINFMDALNAWQLVREMAAATGLPAAASFKHVSPAGVGLGLPLSPELARAYFAHDLELTPLAAAYARARGADRVSSYGDWVALSEPCDEETARLLVREVSDGIIAPGYSDTALEILKSKRRGGYNIVQIDPAYQPAPIERRDIFGVTFSQGRADASITAELLREIVTDAKALPKSIVRDMLLALVTLKYTQSNSVCYVKDGQTIGIGAGQQSRIFCTRLAGDRADTWHLRTHPKVLALPFRADLPRPMCDNAIDVYLSNTPEDILANDVWADTFTTRPEALSADERRAWIAELTAVTLGSDAFFPFGDNVECARRHGVTHIVQPGGSIRDDHVIKTCNKYGITMIFTGTRLFHH